MLIEIPDYFITNNTFKTLPDGDVIYAAYTQHTNQNKNNIQINKNVLIYLIEGTKIIYTDSDTFTIQGKSAIFLKRGHYIISENIADIHHPYRALLFFYDDRLLLDFLNKYSKIKDAPIEYKNECFHISTDTFMQNAIESMIPYFEQSSNQSVSNLIKVKFEEIFLHLLNSPAKNQFTAFLNQLSDSKVDNFMTMIESYADHVSSIEELISHSKMSTSAFRTAFKTHYHTSPKQWLDTRKLEKAALLLKHSDETISRICHSVGFNDFSWFSQRFKDHYGQSPKSYRISKTNNN